MSYPIESTALIDTSGTDSGMSGRFDDTRVVNMGGPGDHWYTDLFTWERPAFGELNDSLIRDIHRYGGDRLFQDDRPLGQRLWELWPHWGRVDEQALRQLAVDLAPIRDDLRASAEASGWEVE